MRRSLALLTLIACLLAAPAASATVTAEGVGVGVFVSSDGAGDTITVTCVGGMAPGGAATQIPCADVQGVIVKAGGGNDTIKLENVGTAIFPELAYTEIQGGEGEDAIDGSQIGDTVESDQEDFVSGGPGNDLIEGGDDVFGGEGDDLMAGTSGSANGGSGDDRFQEAGGIGPFSGGPGADTFELSLPAEQVLNIQFAVENGGLGLTTEAGSGALFWNSIDRVELFLSDGTQSVDASGFAGAVEADGRGGNDLFVGSPGEDLLIGGPGNDDLTGGPGFDWVIGGFGADRLQLRDGEVDRGVCGEDADSAIADAVDSLGGCESVDLPAVPLSAIPPPPVDPAPDTKGLKGPKKVAKGKVASFSFASSETGSTFKCKVDKGPYKACKSPFKVKTGKLALGKHALFVFAVDRAGNVDPTPASRKFTVTPPASAK